MLPQPYQAAYLGRGVVFRLPGASDRRPPLVRIDELALVVQDDASRAGEDECLHARILRCLYEVLRSSDVDLLVDLGRQVEVWRRRVDDSVWLDLGQQLRHGREVGDVAVVVRDGRAGIAVRVCPEVEHGNLCLGMALDDVVDNVAAEKAAASDDDNLSERFGSFCGRHCCSVESEWPDPGRR